MVGYTSTRNSLTGDPRAHDMRTRSRTSDSPSARCSGRPRSPRSRSSRSRWASARPRPCSAWCTASCCAAFRTRPDSRLVHILQPSNTFPDVGLSYLEIKDYAEQVPEIARRRRVSLDAVSVVRARRAAARADRRRRRPLLQYVRRQAAAGPDVLARRGRDRSAARRARELQVLDGAAGARSATWWGRRSR